MRLAEAERIEPKIWTCIVEYLLAYHMSMAIVRVIHHLETPWGQCCASWVLMKLF